MTKTTKDHIEFLKILQRFPEDERVDGACGR